MHTNLHIKHYLLAFSTAITLSACGGSADNNTENSILLSNSSTVVGTNSKNNTYESNPNSSSTNVSENTNIENTPSTAITKDKNKPNSTNIDISNNNTYIVPEHIMSLRKNNHKIGPMDVNATPLSRGTKFASPTGTGRGLSKDDPMSLREAIRTLDLGDVLFLKGGIYKNWGNRLQINYLDNISKDTAVIIESYPGEKAIIDGNFTDSKYGFLIEDDYISLRNLEIRNIPHTAIKIDTASHNIVEGCHIHHNRLMGIQLTAKYDKTNAKYLNGYNLIQNNSIHDNSDAGYYTGSFDDGDNADGISVSSGIDNKILNNEVYGNSDDGIDVWGGTNTEIAYNIVYKQGKGKKGNGNGLKLGSPYDNGKPTAGLGTYVHNNISYENKRHGLDLSEGRAVKVSNNTTYSNGWKGYGNMTSKNVILKNNISLQDIQGAITASFHNDNSINNSWQLDGSLNLTFKNILQANESTTIGAFSSIQ